ncbi:MAG TPA: HK97 family phage prohead protease [Candidatus Aquilonibacter sp.]|jgi:HK97 family phage prohead protease|nr:HK97 family phage prohead protease [Candidatus Aquilonibacter sp.]
MKVEYRKAELRAATNAFEVAGRAASYNTPSSDLGGFVEKLQRGCFTRSLAAGEDVKCLVNHDANQVLGRLANKTLTLTDSPDGLNFVCKLNKDSQAHRDLYASVKRGDLSECSFAFIVDGDDGQSFSAPDRNGLLTRTIKRAKLLDVSVVASPAYGNGATSVDARAAAAAVTVSKRQQHERARKIMVEYPELDAETIASRMRLYSGDTLTDVLLQLRFAAVTKRQGVAFEAEPMRYQSGSAEDPQQTFRGEYGIHPEAARTTAEHEESAKYHTNCAAKAKSLAEAEGHYHAADRHAYAAAYPNDTLASDRARQASRIIGHPENSL